MLKQVFREALGFLVRFVWLPFFLRMQFAQRRVPILVYHDPTPKVLRKHIRYLSKRFQFIPLSRLVNALHTQDWNDVPLRSLVITFDDGHKGNFQLLDIFKTYRIMPIIYICSHIVDTNRHFWWKSAYPDPHRLKGLPYDELLSVLLKEVGYYPEKGYSERQSLNSSEIYEMHPYVEFGCHTRFHPVLTNCSDQICWEEIETSKKHLEALLSKAVVHFAYPNGDYGAREIDYVRKCGYDSARTLYYGWNDLDSDPYRLKVSEIHDDASINILCAQLGGIFRYLKLLRPAFTTLTRNHHPANTRKVLMIGPYPLRQSYDGISAVISSYLTSKYLQKYLVTYISTSCIGNVISKLLALLKSILRIIILSMRKDIKLWHIHSASWRSFYRKMIFVCLGQIFNKKIILQIHGGEFQYFYNWGPKINRWLITQTLNRVHLIAVVSPYWKKVMADLTDHNRIRVIRNPVDTNHFALSISGGKLGNDFQSVLFIGRLSANKGIYDLLKAAAIILRRIPSVRFVICGGGELDRYRLACEELGILDRVIFKGWVNGVEKMETLRQADVFVLPSYHEGLPVTIVEAMSAGLPIVSTSVGGIPDVVQDGVNGYLVTPGDVATLADRILKVLEDKSLAEEISEQNAFYARQTFDINVIIQQLDQIYRDLL